MNKCLICGKELTKEETNNRTMGSRFLSLVKKNAKQW